MEKLMKKTTLGLLVILSASTAFSKQLTVVCERQNPSIGNLSRATLGAVMEIANINATPVLQQLYIGGTAASQGKVAESAFTKNTAKLYIQFGQYLYSSANIAVQDCQDSFSATGAAQLKQYTGGFAGTSLSNLVCTCELK